MLGKVVLCLVLQFAYTNSARILGIVPTPSYSHQVPFQPIWRELSLRGHQVTVLTTDPINDPSLTNLTEIDLHDAYEFLNSRSLLLASGKYKNPIAMINKFFETLIDVADFELQNPKVQQLILDKSEHFDLVIVEYFIPIMFAFGERFKCPMIGMISVDAPNYFLKEFGSPSHPLLYRTSMLPYVGNMNFFQRIISTIFYVIFPLIKDGYTENMQEIVHKHFGNDFAHITDFKKNVTMLFSNGDLALSSIKALVPNVIQIGGGIHMKQPKPLPSNIEKFIEDAHNGVIYFSLGSNVKSKDLTETAKAAILKTFSELPHRVLWKFELDMANKSENVLVSNWLPQQDILRHPNTKLFITQGGYQSLEEALYSKVPMLGIPFLADQVYNINMMVYKGLGLSIMDVNINKHDFKSKILEIIQNPKYKKKVEELSEIALDQPMTGLERAIWWTEYAIRHKGAPHLKSPALDLPTYQYYFLDVIGFCLVILILALYAVVKIVFLFLKLSEYLFGKKYKID